MTTNNYVWEKDLSLNDLVLKQKEEIERLNNIINGLEKKLVASILYDNDKKVDMIHELEEKNKRLNNNINELEKWLEVNLTNLEKEKANNTYDKRLKQGMLSNGRLIKNKLQELKGSDK